MIALVTESALFYCLNFARPGAKVDLVTTSWFSRTPCIEKGKFNFLKTQRYSLLALNRNKDMCSNGVKLNN